ncbi:UNVERIFIED_CONTAM: hypothetical protein Sradi_1914500 [Sesamum radiatum]|uniref:DUF4218 domain-containing protein n=1 Tax=Sesamum radiatum TaxID=300843 RepID=A0AAW2U1W1_SESRA
MLHESVWSALTEVSLLFQIICSTTLDVGKVKELRDNVPTMLCNLEIIFPPSFFNTMEHLIIHLPYETCVAGPVQYRWMHSFEGSFLNELYEHYHSEDPIIEELVATQFKDWVKRRNEPFILAQEAVQVYYIEYPSMKMDKVNWLVVCKIKARRVVDDSRWTEVGAGMSRAANGESNDEPNDDRFDEDYETKDNNYD